MDTDDSGRPSFTSIAKDTGFLDKELAASGFTRKDQEEIAKVCVAWSMVDSIDTFFLCISGAVSIFYPHRMPYPVGYSFIFSCSLKQTKISLFSHGISSKLLEKHLFGYLLSCGTFFFFISDWWSILHHNAQFIEGGIKKDASSDDEDTEDDEDICVLNEENLKGVESLHAVDQVHLSLVLFFF